MRHSVAAAVAMVVVCGTALPHASSPGQAGPSSPKQSAALQVSVVVVPSCAVQTDGESAGTQPSLACSRGALPKGFTPRIEIVSPDRTMAPTPAADTPPAIRVIHF